MSYGSSTIDPCDRSAREMAQSKAKLAIQLTKARRVARRDMVGMASVTPNQSLYCNGDT